MTDLLSIIFPNLSTHRIPKNFLNDAIQSYFPFEGWVAAASVFFCRYTVRLDNESRFLRLLFSTCLAVLAHSRRVDYRFLILAQLCSYLLLVYRISNSIVQRFSQAHDKYQLRMYSTSITILILSFFVRMIYSSPSLSLSLWKPYILSIPGFHMVFSKMSDALKYLIPIDEVLSAYNTMLLFVPVPTLHTQMKHLLYVTFNIQVGMGFLGIGFLRKEQERKNELILLESEVRQQDISNQNHTCNGSQQHYTKDKMVNGTADKDQPSPKQDLSLKFQRGAIKFILFSAVPYMAQIVFFGAMNMYAYNCFRDDLHRTIRLTELFRMDGSRFVATATVGSTLYSPGTYAMHMETVVSTVYTMFNEKLFSLPKILLLPGMIGKQPLLLLKIFPFIILSDVAKSSVVSSLTNEIEALGKEMKTLESRRTRLEQWDIRFVDLIQRSGVNSIAFTERRWVELTETIHNMATRRDLIKRSRQYFTWLQRNFIMMTLVDCALAKLISLGKIVAADIFVIARAMEDVIDLVLMRSRAHSELASMETSIKVLYDLKNTWDKSEQRNFIECTVRENPQETLIIDGLSYKRGLASVQINNLILKPGVYAVTGANGSGKSTLFRILIGCDTNDKSVDLANSIEIVSPGSIIMPSSDVVEISQNVYWPLYTKPIDWIYHKHLDQDVIDPALRESMIKELLAELKSLFFYRDLDIVGRMEQLRQDLTEVKEDWFGDLSGGQKSKVELIRKVFLAEQCPKVLLIDETFAPLDPESKSIVMTKLKSFCDKSFVLVIYHADVASDDSGATTEPEPKCLPASNFFDDNLHVEDGHFHLRPICDD